MEIITSLEAVKTEYSPSVIALGTFDGLHWSSGYYKNST